MKVEDDCDSCQCIIDTDDKVSAGLIWTFKPLYVTPAQMMIKRQHSTQNNLETPNIFNIYCSPRISCLLLQPTLCIHKSSVILTPHICRQTLHLTVCFGWRSNEIKQSAPVFSARALDSACILPERERVCQKVEPGLLFTEQLKNYLTNL